MKAAQSEREGATPEAGYANPVRPRAAIGVMTVAVNGARSSGTDAPMGRAAKSTKAPRARAKPGARAHAHAKGRADGDRAPRKTPPQAAAQVAALCRLIEASETLLPLEALARHVGLSAFHTHRLFKAATGITPRAYAISARRRRLTDALRAPTTVAAAIYGAGYSSSGRFYEDADAMLGMLPSAYKAGGVDVCMRFAVGECSLGSILVAATERGVCAISLGDDPEALVHALERRFPRATLAGADAAFEALVAKVVGLVDRPHQALPLPLDIRGTAFQQRVWQAISRIPPGETLTYSQLAEAIGAPKAVRAVARACAANTLAVAIPCHRVVRTDGSLSGYRWGIARKRALLDRERLR